MMRNPVFNREMKVSSRSMRLPILLMLFNGILFLVTLVNMYSVVEQVKNTANISYSSFIEIYSFVTTIEFVLLLFLVPAVTASSISGERERQTLELMLTTQMTAFQVVFGKLLAALSTLMLLIISSFPAIAMVFVYGGITWGDMGALVLCYVTVALFAGGIGLCCSAVFKRSTVATVVTYGILIAIIVGGYFANQLAFSLSTMNLNRVSMAYSFGESMAKPSSGGAFYLFLLNPAITFMGILAGQTGSRPMTQMCSLFGMEYSGFVMEHWILISIALQLAAAVVLIAVAVRAVEPVKYRNKGSRREKRGGSE